MRIFRTNQGILIEHQSEFFRSKETNWDKFVNRPGLFVNVLNDLEDCTADPLLSQITQADLLPPIGNQEVWASGVTYMRSCVARIEESQRSGGGDFYARVYEAHRPELFFKATAYRTVGTGDKVRIRKDSKWNVPEPELTLFICSAGSIEGYTIGNDMSSRDIEGENPLYLPQAKSYEGSTAIGPCLYVPENPINPDSRISILIKRNEVPVFANEISINRMRRTHIELADCMFSELSFPHGTYLMTGTGIVPPDNFSLLSEDVIEIAIENIGELVNTVA
jgi:2-dehydro-3-deoxy-D-arabinonate dehydratase